MLLVAPECKKFSEVEIEALRRKVTTPQEIAEVLIENDPVEDSDVTPVIQTGVEKNHPAADGGMEETDELHLNDDSQRKRRMMQENSSDPTSSLRGIDALKVKSTVSEVNDIICNIRVKNLDELKNLLRAGAKLVCNKIGVIANKKEFKEPYWKRRIANKKEFKEPYWKRRTANKKEFKEPYWKRRIEDDSGKT